MSRFRGEVVRRGATKSPPGPPRRGELGQVRLTGRSTEKTLLGGCGPAQCGPRPRGQCLHTVWILSSFAKESALRLLEAARQASPIGVRSGRLAVSLAAGKGSSEVLSEERRAKGKRASRDRGPMDETPWALRHDEDFSGGRQRRRQQRGPEVDQVPSVATLCGPPGHLPGASLKRGESRNDVNLNNTLLPSLRCELRYYRARLIEDTRRGKPAPQDVQRTVGGRRRDDSTERRRRMSRFDLLCPARGLAKFLTSYVVDASTCAGVA